MNSRPGDVQSMPAELNDIHRRLELEVQNLFELYARESSDETPVEIALQTRNELESRLLADAAVVDEWNESRFISGRQELLLKAKYRLLNDIDAQREYCLMLHPDIPRGEQIPFYEHCFQTLLLQAAARLDTEIGRE